MSGSMDVGYLPTYLRAEDLGNCDCKRAPQWEISSTLTLTGGSVSALLHQVAEVLQLKIKVADDLVERLSY